MARFLRFYGYDFEVKTYAWYRVAMAKCTDKEKISEEAFDATCRLYERESDIETIDYKIDEIKQGEYFTFADIKWDLRIKVTAHDYESAFEEADGMAQMFELPADVAFIEAQSYDYEWTGEEVVGE